MPFASKLVAIVVFTGALAPLELYAQAETQVDPSWKKAAADGARLTGKERLGEKWKDEQRVDNCKVPTEKRGERPRTDSCARTPSR